MILAAAVRRFWVPFFCLQYFCLNGFGLRLRLARLIRAEQNHRWSQILKPMLLLWLAFAHGPVIRLPV